METLQKGLLIVIVCLALVSTGYTQRLALRHYSIEDGMLSSTVNRIVQDSKGYLWFATEGGFCRFDGLGFRNYTGEDGLPNNSVKDILEDHRGQIWLATTAGLSCFSDGVFKNYTPKEGLFSYGIISLSEDGAGNLWIGGVKGVCKLDKSRRVFTNFSPGQYLGGNHVHKILCDKTGHVWIGTENGLSRFSNGSFSHYSTGDGLPGNRVLSICEDHRGRIWVGTPGGAAVFDGETFTAYTREQGLLNNLVFDVMEDKEKNIWLGTAEGLSIFSNGSFTNYTTRNGLLSRAVVSLARDREANIWIGTPAGVSCLKTLMFTTYSSMDGLPSNIVWSILEDRQGRYWFGTEEGLGCYTGGKFTTYSTRNGLVKDWVLELMESREGRIWIATNGGISSFDGRSFTNYTSGDGLPEQVIYSLAQAGDGVIWAGTVEGLYYYRDGRFFKSSFPQLNARDIYDILDGPGRELWLGTSSGLFRVSGDKVTRFTVDDGLVHDNIYSLFLDGKGSLWIGTSKGMSRYRDGRFTNYTTSDGLPHDRCCFFLEDNAGSLWIGTQNGVSCFDGRDFKNYTVKNGLASNTMTDGGCFKDSGGGLWMGSMRGVTRIEPSLARPAAVASPVYITHFKAMEQDFPVMSFHSLPHDRNFIKFQFIGLFFTAPESVMYRYRLSNSDQGWIESANPSASYSFLPPGEYRFDVFARNSDGVESPRPASVSFRILPPFWKTWWFRLMAFAGLLTLLALFSIRRDKRIKERVEFQERTRQLIMAQRMELLGILAGGAVHDLKNLLGIIIGYSRMATQLGTGGGDGNDSGDAGEQSPRQSSIVKIQKTAMTAVQVVKQILSFARQKSHEVTTANLVRLLGDIIEVLKITIPPEIKVSWNPPVQDISMKVNTARFQQVVMNLCLNAVQAMPGGGELEITLVRVPVTGNIELGVSDTGSGMDEETLEKIFTPLYTTKTPEQGSGLGLFVVKQIVDEYKGTIDVRSKQGEGTSFLISLPPTL